MSDAASVVSIAVGLVTLISTLGRFFIYKPIVRLIEDRTQPIQKHANGGLSLPDVARALDRVEKKLDRHLEYHLDNK